MTNNKKSDRRQKSKPAIKAGQKRKADAFDGAIPSGGIIMWSGSADSIPEGWALCDGQKGTPNLMNRFVVGAGDEYSVNSTGGQKEVTLSVNQMPSHNHVAQTGTDGAHEHDYLRNGAYNHNMRVSWDHSDNQSLLGLGGDKGAGSYLYIGSEGSAHSHQITVNNTGGGQAHENRPPYYALAFIIKL